jgi:hypothetical protein
MHRRDLEIWHEGKADVEKQDKPAFHFSSDNDGYYWLFDYYINENPDNRRRSGCHTAMTCIAVRRNSPID